MADEYTSAQTLAPAATHWPPYDPGPAIEKAREDAARALHSVATFGSPALMRAMGYEPPEWMQALEHASQNPEVNTAMSMLSGPIGRMSSVRGMLGARRSGQQPLETVMFQPPAKSQRPFEVDYPVLEGKRGEKLTRDIEGRPLNPGATVVGRRVVGGKDYGITPAELDALTTEALGQPPIAVGDKDLRPGTAGGYAKVPGQTPEILFHRDLSPQGAWTIAQHETGHMINDFAGPQTKAPPLRNTYGLIPAHDKRELASLYNDLNNPTLGGATRYTPETHGYPAGIVQHEYMAEAVRAYLADPNYMKTVAPHTAAAIRKAVNENPKLAQWIQFNAVLPPIGPSERRQGDNVPGEAKQSGLMERWEKAFNEAGEHPRMPWEPTPDPEELERTRKVATGVVTGLPVGGFLGVAAKKLSPMLGPLTMGGVGAGLGGTLGASYQHKPKGKEDKGNPATQEQVRTLRQKIIDQMKQFRNEAPEEDVGPADFDKETRAKIDQYFDLASKAGLIWTKEQYQDLYNFVTTARDRFKIDNPADVEQLIKEYGEKILHNELDQAGRAANRSRRLGELLFQ